MQRPSALGLFLCDQVLVDRDSGKRTLVGLFDTLACPLFPFVCHRLIVYAALTDGQGRMAFDLVLSDIETEEQLSVRSIEAELPGPLTVAHFLVRYESLVFPAPGQYRFELFADQGPICH